MAVLCFGFDQILLDSSQRKVLTWSKERCLSFWWKYCIHMTWNPGTRFELRIEFLFKSCTRVWTFQLFSIEVVFLVHRRKRVISLHEIIWSNAETGCHAFAEFLRKLQSLLRFRSWYPMNHSLYFPVQTASKFKPFHSNWST